MIIEITSLMSERPLASKVRCTSVSGITSMIPCSLKKIT